MLYAAYGSNLHPDRLRQRVPSATLLATAAVSGWELRFHKRGADGSAKCNIVPARAVAVQVRVALYRLDPAEWVRLDRAEGLGNGYDHGELAVPGHGRVVTYLAAASHIDGALKPFPWYKAYVLAGCRFHSFGADYTDRIAGLAETRDPDAGRQRRHMARMRLFPTR